MLVCFTALWTAIEICDCLVHPKRMTGAKVLLLFSVNNLFLINAELIDRIRLDYVSIISRNDKYI